MSVPRESKTCEETTTMKETGWEFKKDSEAQTANVNGDQTSQHSSTHPYEYLDSVDHAAALQQYATTAYDGAQSSQCFEFDSAFPYQRYNSYVPIVQQDSTENQAATGYDQTISGYRDGLLYCSTPSNPAASSYNITSSVAFNNTSPIQASPIPDQIMYTPYDNHSTGCWNAQTACYNNETQENALVGIGAQFGTHNGCKKDNDARCRFCRLQNSGRL